MNESRNGGQYFEKAQNLENNIKPPLRNKQQKQRMAPLNMLPTSSAYLENGNNSMVHISSQPNSVSGYVRIKSRENSIFGA